MTHRESLDGLIEAWRNGDAVRAVSFFALDATYRESARDAVAGRTAMLEHFSRFFRDGPLWEFIVEQTVLEGNFGAVRYRFVLKPADGKPVERNGCAFVTFRDGTIVEWREYQG